MGPDTENYENGPYGMHSTYPGTPAPEMELDTVLDAVKKFSPIIDNAFIPSLTGIKIVVNDKMNPNDCTLVVGTEYYKRLRQAIEDQDEKTETED